MASTLILGLGNLILGDDGLGVRMIERLLEQYALPAQVEAIEGGTLGLHLLPYLEGVQALLIIDAIWADQPPGSLIRLEGEALPVALNDTMSPHQFGLAELLAVGSLYGPMPQRIVLWGIVPASMEFGLELSEPVAAKLDELMAQLVAELAGWGIRLQPRSDEA
ncbi:MAG: HyaD/HybD family hydrogenase maturation endopeptidase [Oscillochloridaceae bacterium umkhey_bin13]